MNKNLKLLGLLITFILFMPGVKAATVKVCSTCTNSTIDAAIASATTGDTIEVSTGSYAGFSLPASKAFTVKGVGNVVITSDITVAAGALESTISGLTLTGRVVNVAGGKIHLKNNTMGTINASGTADVDAENNWWGTANPVFASLVSTSDTAKVDSDPYYSDSKYLGSNILSISQTLTEKTLKVDEYLGITEYLNIESNGVYNMTYASSDETIASINDQGSVHALKEGKTTITVTTSFGTIYNLEVTVVCVDEVKNPNTSMEWYVVAFVILLGSGLYFGIKSYKKMTA